MHPFIHSILIMYNSEKYLDKDISCLFIMWHCQFYMLKMPPEGKLVVTHKNKLIVSLTNLKSCYNFSWHINFRLKTLLQYVHCPVVVF